MSTMGPLHASQFRPTPTDGYPTPTSTLQTDTEYILSKHVPSATRHHPDITGSAAGNTAVPSDDPILQRTPHLQFLLRNLLQGFPSHYVSQDASQPWLIFWTLQGFSVLGVGLDDRIKKRSRETLLALQHLDGGFSGGPGQAPHLLPTYAAICSLAIVGQPGEGGAWDAIDRGKMYNFFMSLKQTDGSFLVARDAEVDVRGIYCLLAVATLLNLITPQLVKGLPEFIVSCQTYEGGFGNASFPEWAFQEEGSQVRHDPSLPRPVLGEAHGGYTFCAIASWVLLQPYIRTYYGTPSTAEQPGVVDASSASFDFPPSSGSVLPAPNVNLRALLRWLAHMQGTEVEVGGFKGRTNKLVDGCYSWWVGGCFGLVEGLLEEHHGSSGVHGVGRPSAATEERGFGAAKEREESKEAGEDGWHDADDALFHRRALQEYLLYVGQHPAGGLRDKPPKPADAYHTLYCLSGLSAAQHRVAPDDVRRRQLVEGWKETETKPREGSSTNDRIGTDKPRLETLRKEVFTRALCWVEDEGADEYVGGSGNRVNATQPLFNLTVTHAEMIMAHFYGQTLPHKRHKTMAANK